MLETRWNILQDCDTDSTHEKKIHPIVSKVLRHKGISDEVEMEEFLSLKPQKTYDPHLLKNMTEAVEVITHHLKQHKSIWIYGDYDVDGISSIALLMQFLGNFTSKINYYIPLRAEEGYGLNCEAIAEIKEKGGELIITVDCGSTSIKEVELAKALGMEIIVTDHHNLSHEAPECLIINPKQMDCYYPFKGLCGCGIAFKLAQALQKELNAPKRTLSELLDLVALATVADVVALVDENRTLMKYGLNNINSVTRPGLKYLIEAINLHEKEISSTQIGFILAPYFNASGRIDDARAGVELLITKDVQRIEELATHLMECNQERKIIQEQGIELSKDKVEKFHRNDLFLVVDSENTHEGVIGIIAGRIRDIYYRPTLIVAHSSEDGIIKGSGRSIDGIDIYEELKSCSDLLIKFGGHKNACGFSLKRDNLELLRERLNIQLLKILKENPEMFVKKINIYGELKASDMTNQLVEELRRIEPYGMGNEKPIFVIKQLKLKSNSQPIRMGKNKEHIKLMGTLQDNSENILIQAVGFGIAEYFVGELGCPEIIDLVGFPDANEWNGNRTIQFMIQDMKKQNS